MVDVGISQLVVSVPQVQQSAPVGVPVRASEVLPQSAPAEAVFDPQVAEQKREQAVQVLSQQVADVFVLGDTSFTIFKDSTGKYITRFTSLRDGKVTYIPEPSLYKLGNSSAPTVQLKA